MKLPGVLGMLSLVGGLLLAIPMGIIGFELLARGSPWLGGLFLGLAVAVLFLPEYVMRKIPGPRTVIHNKISRFRRDD